MYPQLSFVLDRCSLPVGRERTIIRQKILNEHATRDELKGKPKMTLSLRLAVVLIAVVLAGPSAAQVRYNPGEMRVDDQPGHIPERGRAACRVQTPGRVLPLKPSLRARSSCTRRSALCIWFRATTGPCATASAWAAGFQWAGLLITRKAEWPDWTPPPEMIERRPYFPRYGGRRGNPMGARALYLGAPSIEFTAPMSRTPLGRPFRPAASEWSTTTWSISMTASRLGRRSSFVTPLACKCGQV